MKRQIDKWWFKYVDLNKNKKIDWWEYSTFISHAIVLISFFVGGMILLLSNC